MNLPTPDIPAWIAEQRAACAVQKQRWEGVAPERMEAALSIIEGLLAQHEPPPRLQVTAGFSALLVTVVGVPPERCYQYRLRQLDAEVGEVVRRGSSTITLELTGPGTYVVGVREVRESGVLGPEMWTEPVQFDALLLEDRQARSWVRESDRVSKTRQPAPPSVPLVLTCVQPSPLTGGLIDVQISATIADNDPKAALAQLLNLMAGPVELRQAP
jgi:hypothetical protein